MDLDAQFLVQSAIALFGLISSGGFFTLWRDKRKAEAETSKTKSEATGTDATTAKTNQEWMEDEIARLVSARDAEKKISLTRKRAGAKLYRAMLNHEAWDEVVIAKLAEVGVIIPHPPHLELTQEEMDALEV